MAFDWMRFLSAHRVPFVTRGPNTGRDHVSVKCPWCGEADPSEHLGISLKGKGWGCLREPRHRGRSRAKLIQALLRCSSETARHLAGEENPIGLPPPAEGFAERVRGLLGLGEDRPRSAFSFLPEFRPLRSRSFLSAPFWDYLRERGYTDSGIAWLAETYNLHYARTGAYRYRIIVPVYDAYGALMTWTGRTISPDIELRYKTVKAELSVKDPKRLLLGLPLLYRVVNPEVLVVTEGPFDAFRVTVLGHEQGAYATCIFGLSLSDEQLELVVALTARFRRVVLLLDPEARWTALSLLGRLAGLGVRVGTLPGGVEDPGTLRPRETQRLIQSWLT